MPGGESEVPPLIRCAGCKQSKPPADFTKNKRGKYGLSCYCRDCTRLRSRRFYVANRERMIERSRQWRRDNPEYERQYHPKRYQRNKAQRNAYGQDYYRRNREWFRNHRARWVEANREVHRHHVRTRRTRKAEVPAIPFTAEQLEQRWAYYGGKCWLCGADATAVDHVKPISKGGAHMLGNLRPICKPCNSRKHNKWPYP